LDTSIQTDFDFFERGKTFGDDFVEDRMEKFYRVFGMTVSMSWPWHLK